jgi:hypothetical protein
MGFVNPVSMFAGFVPEAQKVLYELALKLYLLKCVAEGEFCELHVRR